MTTADYWPSEYSIRDNQQVAFDWVDNNKDKKYLLLELPVGGGKSDFAITHSLANTIPRLNGYRGDSYILTPQIILQKQYEDSFLTNDKISMGSLYGKSNYKCESKNANCEIGGLVKPRCQSCPHEKAKQHAQKAANTILNYRLALTNFAHTTSFEPRQLMVFDECHTLEEQLVDFDAVSIIRWKCQKYKIPFKQQRTLDDAIKWMKSEYLFNLNEILEDLQEESERLLNKPGTELTRSEIKKLKEINLFVDHVDEVTVMCSRTSEYINDNFVLVHDKDKFEFKRLTGAYAFNKFLEPRAKQFLFMSSTILNKDGFCKDLGIDPDQSAFLSLQSEFPKDNRPVYFMPHLKMNAKWKDKTNVNGRKKFLNTIITLLEMQEEESGIIHTGNFEIAKWLVTELVKVGIPQNIFHHNPDSEYNRTDVINSFMESSKPSILISPSITEGLDLKDDLSRFAIFAKLGFPYLGDQWIKRKMEISSEWYVRRTLIDVIQGSGRIVRSSEDWGNVYILDGSFAYLKNKTNYMIPTWWRESIKVL